MIFKNNLFDRKNIMMTGINEIEYTEIFYYLMNLKGLIKNVE
jgi:hypothetical protein